MDLSLILSITERGTNIRGERGGLFKGGDLIFGGGAVNFVLRSIIIIIIRCYEYFLKFLKNFVIFLVRI